MKQIKTIINKSAAFFDEEVNAALREGWELGRRYTDSDGFIAELEREEPTTEELRCCETCKHGFKPADVEPCLSCSADADKWEPLL